MGLLDSLITFLQGMGIFSLSWQMVGMWGIAVLLLYLGVAKQYEPLLMVPIAFGALIANIPDNGMLITQLNQQVISSNKAGEVTATSLNNVGYLRVHVAPLQQTPAKVPANLTTPEARAQYLETMQQIYSSTSKVMIDAKGQGNLLYLPLDKLMQATAAVTAPRSAAEAVAPAATGNRPAFSGEVPPQTEGSPNFSSREGRSSLSSRERETR